MSVVYIPQVKFLRKWGVRGDGDGEFRWPQSLAIDVCGNLYVSECINDRIQVFDVGGRFIRKWEGYGKADVAFSMPQSLVVDNEGDVYISDEGNHRILVFKTSV